MPISHQYKCLFIHIPKTGGTSVESALGIFGDWKIEDQNLLFGKIESEEIKRLGYKSHFLQHLTYDQCLSIKEIPKEYLRFSFVRNPWDKMVSIYSNPDNNLIEIAKKKGINIQNISFDKFINVIKDIEHIHLEEQHKFICDEAGEILIDFIGRFESLSQDFNKLCSLLGVTADLPHKNHSKHMLYREYYTEETKNIIAKRYQRDIELFNYSY